METLYPASHTFISNWLKQGFQRTNWTTEENGKFERCLAFFDKDTPDRWLKVASLIPGKSVLDVIEQYKKLEDDISDIEAGLFPLPGNLEDDASTKKLVKNPEPNEFGKRPFACRSSEHEKKKGVPWTEDEHRQFLMGLRKHGKGDWRNISRNFVITKTSTQVASHAQKYYLRQLSEGKEKKRPSIHDITTVHLTDATPSDKRIFSADQKSTFIPQPEKSISMPKKVLDWNKTDDGSLMMFNSMHNNTFMPFKHEFGGHGADSNPLNSGFQFQATRHQICIAGNNFLCSSTSTEICTGVPNTVNGTNSYKQVSSHHRWIVSVVIGVSCTFVVSVLLLVCWLHWYRSNILATSYVQQDCEFDQSYKEVFFS